MDLCLPYLRREKYLLTKDLWWAFAGCWDKLTFFLWQHTLCYAVVKRTESLKGLPALQDKSFLSRNWQGQFCSSTLLSMAGQTERKAVPVPSLCWQTYDYFCLATAVPWHWGTLFCSLRTMIIWQTSGCCHGLKNIFRVSHCSLIHTPSNHYQPWTMFCSVRSGLFFFFTAALNNKAFKNT